MRIVFLGTAAFGVPALRALHARYDIPLVVTRPDTPKGRGLKPAPSPVSIAAEALGIADILTPERLDDPELLDRLAASGADLFFVIAFRILPPALFTIPPRGTVNLHASLLPDYRGAAPIQWAIMNGESETGLTTFFIDESVDTGDIILQTRIPIGPEETAGELAARMSGCGAGLAVDTVERIERGDVACVRQPLTGGHAAPKLVKSDGRIDWTLPARRIHDRVRGLNPAPGAYAETARGRIKIHRTAVLATPVSGEPGRVIAASPKDGPAVACGDGAVRLVEVQPPGKSAMDGASFVRGYRVAEGMRFADLV